MSKCRQNSIWNIYVSSKLCISCVTLDIYSSSGYQTHWNLKLLGPLFFVFESFYTFFPELSERPEVLSFCIASTVIGFIHMRNKSRYPQRNWAIFPRKYFMVHIFQQELSRFNLKGVTWQFAMTSYFLSESATITSRSQKNPIKGKSVFKIHRKILMSGSILIIILSRYIDRKCCHVTCIMNACSAGYTYFQTGKLNTCVHHVFGLLWDMLEV